MDGKAFDAMTRRVGETTARRGLLRAGLGTLAAAALGLLGLGASEDTAEGKKSGRKRKTKPRQRSRDSAERVQVEKKKNKKKSKKKKSCPPCKKRKKGKCKGRLADGAACPGGTCQGGSCLPATPTCTCQGKTCGDDGCGGSCGSCGEDFSCENGGCVLDCRSGLSECGDACRDLQTDPANCGACGMICQFAHASARCEDSTCQLATCDAGYANCDEQPENGCETDIQTDPAHCGDCGTKCRFAHASARCEDGTCALGTCDPGYGNCDGQAENGCEANLRIDLDHCGSCDKACNRDTQVCDGGTCANCDVCANGCRFSSIQEAVDAAEDDETIRVCAGTWTLTSTIVVDTNLTLIGAGTNQTILDGNDSVRVLLHGDSGLSVQPTTTVRDLTITRGRALGDGEEGWGGGIFNHGTLTLTDVAVTDNTADSGGGCRNEGTLNLVDSSVTDNSTTFGAAGIFNHGFDGNGALTLIRSRVTDNICGGDHTSGDGGGIYNYVGMVTMEESHVTGNTAHSGGGIFNLGQGNVGSAKITVKAGSTVSDNTANFGGGIRNNFGTLTLEPGSSVSGNTAGVGGGIGNDGKVTLEAADIVTDNHLADGTTVSNCAPVDTIPNCIG